MLASQLQRTRQYEIFKADMDGDGEDGEDGSLVLVGASACLRLALVLL